MVGSIVTRRRFLIAGALIGGGIAIGFGYRSKKSDSSVYSVTANEDEFALNAWVKIDIHGIVTVAIPRSEMGQGVFTSLAMLVAEELDADFSTIRVEQSPIAGVYANITVLQDQLPFFDDYHKGENTLGAQAVGKIGEILGVQITGGSSSVRDAWGPMRQAGATARQMLLSAAAKNWKVPIAECRTKDGFLYHNKTDRKASYGEFVTQASLEILTEPAKLKAPAKYTIIGKPKQRLDIPSKVTGETVFGIDTEQSDMTYAAAKLSPVFGAKLHSYDATEISSLPGVLKVVALEAGVAVVADSYWRAQTAVKNIPVTFGDSKAASVSTEIITTILAENLADGGSWTYSEVGDVDAALSEAKLNLSATYSVPYLAHACLEPMNCTAIVKDDRVEIWMSNQAPTLIKWFAAKTAGISADNVEVHTTMLGGGFGRRVETDLVVMAVTIAMELKNRPVKLIWTRENDIQHDMFRPAAMARFDASIASGGKINAWKNRIASQSVSKAITSRLLPWAAMDVPDKTTSEGAADIPYEFNHLLVEHVPVDLPVPVGIWRSVGHSYNAFFTESFMDEAAAFTKTDPIDFRLNHLEDHPDITAVLTKIRKISKWSTPLTQGRGRGIALHLSFGSIVAQVAEVTVSADKEVTVDKVYCVVDCGTVVNPDTVIAQMEGGIIFGLTAALFGEIIIESGQVTNENFPDYDMIRLANSPVIETHLVPSGRPMGGVGEPGTPPIAPAVTNAIFAATGNRIRQLPITKSGYFG
jgi:isoquinoline 1-oxidoreductase subunit beta